jgi:hypothetical protein
VIPVGVRKRLWLSVGMAAVAAVAAASAYGGSGRVVTTTFSSGADHATGAEASGRCSKAAAREVVKQLRLGDPSVADPFGKVLCGAFTGPGSQAMVVVLRGPGSTGFVDWVVFRWAGGAWQFLMKQPLGGSITAAGSDIRQTLPIYRPADSRCCPSGGTKTRIWHWNGIRLVAGPWKLTLAKLHLNDFLSPDRKVWCNLSKDSVEDRAWCVTKFPEPVHSATLKRTGEVTICNGFCTQNWYAGAPLLRYGQQTEHYGYRCTSETKGITCTVIAQGRGHGKGFLINRNGVRRVGR